jgi:L-alanine-DL-glutamate epimerase-like enolase superfamily enzyme
VQRRLHNFGRNGPIMYALSGLDIALWDIAGQRAGLPVHRLLGGAGAASVPAYASLMKYGDPDLVTRNSSEAAKRGYRRVKLHEATYASIKAGRDAIGSDLELTVDCSCPWTREEAVAKAHEFAELDLLWLEEPVWPPEDFEGLAQLHDKTGINIAAGENASTLLDYRGLIEVGHVAYLQPSVTKIGGISAMKDVIELAHANGVVVAPHSPYFGPGLIATIHICTTLPDDTYLERLYCDLDASPLGSAIEARNGFIPVPHGPGLGVHVDESVIARYRIA